MIILRVWAKQPGNFFCISSKAPDGTWRDEFFKRSQFKMVPRYISELKEDDCDIYWCPHGFSKARRLRRYAVMPYLLWADLDEARPQDIEPKPAVAWESSPGRYAALWYLEDVLTTDDVNKQWTYHIGADKGGWDLSQVLRVPGTYNHKYPNKPQVKLLWEDGRFTFPEKQFLDIVPQKRERKREGADAARDIFRKYKKHLTAWARREILNGKPQKGKRSEVFWKLVNEMIEAGADEDEAFTLLWASPWNKFRDRRDGEDQLKREIDKVYESKFDGPEGEPQFREISTIAREDDTDRVAELSSLFLSSVPPENTDWIIYPYFARGHITTVEGNPEVGKSWLCLAAGCAVAEGKVPFPQDGWDHKNEQGMVLYFDAENMSHNISMRMIDSGMIGEHKSFHDGPPFLHIPPEVFSPNLGDDDIVEEMDYFIEELKASWKNNKRYPDKVKMIIFDTLVNYSGITDSNKQGDVVQIMNNLKELAVHLDCSVVAIRHHAKTSRDKDPMHRGVGSVQYGASARIVVGVYQHPEDDAQRVLMLGKNSLAHKHWVRALSYTLQPVFPGSTDINNRDRSKMEWVGFSDLTDSDLMITQKERDDKRAEYRKDIEIFRDIVDDLSETNSKGGQIIITHRELKDKLIQTNVPEEFIKKISRHMAQVGFKPDGRGLRARYIKKI